MVLGDLNGDGKLDLAIASHDSYGVMLLSGDGKGGFALDAQFSHRHEGRPAPAHARPGYW